MKKARFKDKMLQAIYELGLTATHPIPLDFYTGALGGSARCAWEHGYEGLKITRYAKNSTTYAAYVAGQEIKKREKKKLTTPEEVNARLNNA